LEGAGVGVCRDFRHTTNIVNIQISG
jgi:hypothetical protein